MKSKYKYTAHSLTHPIVKVTADSVKELVKAANAHGAGLVFFNTKQAFTNKGDSFRYKGWYFERTERGEEKAAGPIKFSLSEDFDCQWTLYVNHSAMGDYPIAEILENERYEFFSVKWLVFKEDLDCKEFTTLSAAQAEAEEMFTAHLMGFLNKVKFLPVHAG
jgi:hypothetical protein